MAEKYPRDREFVRALGTLAERAGRETATVAEMLVAESERTGESARGDSELARRIRRELPRRLATTLDGGGKNGVDFHARWRAIDADATADGTVASTLEGNPVQGQSGVATGANLGIVFSARLPNYQITTGALVRAAAVGSFPGGYAADLPEMAASMLDRTSAAFVFAFPVDGSLKVVPANAITAVDNDGKPLPDDFPERLYARSAGRFFEELVECFVGDHRLVDGADGPGPEGMGHQIETFGREFGLEHVLYLGVEADQPEHNLITDFE